MSNNVEIIKAGKTTIIIGAVLFVLALFGLLLGFESYFQEKGVSFILFIRKDLGFFTGVFLQFFLGASIIIGGIGLKKCREWGRRFIIGSIGFMFCILIVFTIIWQMNVLFVEEINFFKVIFALMGLGVSLFIGVVLWQPLKFFRSKEFRSNCR